MSTPKDVARHQRIVRPDVAPEAAESATTEAVQRNPNLTRGRARTEQPGNDQGPQTPQAFLAPAAAELAEALFLTTQALKSLGRLCMEETDPALRAMSYPRARVMMVMADAQAGLAPISHHNAHVRGRRRERGHAYDQQAGIDTVTSATTEVPVRMNDLAAALGVTARNITTIVDGLEHEGLIARKMDPEDRRAFLVVLTPKGKAHLADVHALQISIADRFFAPLDAAERTELLRLFRKIVADGPAC